MRGLRITTGTFYADFFAELRAHPGIAPGTPHLFGSRS
jgi:hypothetical protein